MLPFKEVVEYTILSGMISLSRSDLDRRFNNNGLLQQALLTDSHYRYYVREMRLKSYSQLLQAYRTINLSRMATEFNVTEEYIEQEVARFIANGRLHCKIDKVARTIVTISAAGCNRGQAPDVTCDRGLIYQNTIKKGDALLNRLKKLGQVINF